MSDTTGRAAVLRLSAPTVRKNPRRALSGDEMATLKRVSAALIPAGENDGEPAGDQIATFGDLTHEALAIMDPVFDEIIAALEEVQSVPDAELFEALRTMDAQESLRFHHLSSLVSAIYVYSPEIEAALGYPHPHRNPASPDEVVDEMDLGLLDPVMERGYIYRQP